MRLNQSVIAITGGGRGLGRAMALRFASQGAQLALLDRDEAALQDTQSACTAAGAKTQAYALDITDEAAVETTFAQV